MKLIKLQCENCGATLEVNENMKKVCCSSCGTEFLLDDGSITHIEKKIDETKIKELEIKDKINMRKLKHEEKEEIICGVIFIIIILILIVFLYNHFINEVNIPFDAKSFKGENYQQVVTELKNAGFKNVEVNAIEDLVTGWIVKDGQVEKVTINGDSKFKEGDYFPKDASIIVTYHTFKEK